MSVPAVPGDPNQSPAPSPPAHSAPQPPAVTPGTFGHFRPLGKLATATCILLGIAAAVSIIAAVAHYHRVTVVRRLLTDRTDLADIDQADNLALWSFWLVAVTFLVTGIVFVIWQYKFAMNAELLHGPLGLGAGWAIGGWFIPIANLVLPFIQLNHAAKASDPDLPPGTTWPGGRAPGVLKAWTATYIAAPLMYVVTTGSTRYDRADTVNSRASQFIRADLGIWFSMLIYTAAGILGLLMVRTVTRRQEQAIVTANTPAPAAG